MKTLFSLLLGVSCYAFAQSPIALKVESVTAPLALDTVVPRFSWQLADETRGARQSAYRIVVTTGDASLWDSGGADTCNRAVHVVEMQGHSGTRFVNSQIYGDIIVEATNNAPLIFSACGLFGSMHAANGIGVARIEGGGKVSFTDCNIHCLDPRNTIRTLIHAKSGRLQVRGCDFIDGALPREHIVLDEGVMSANISDNTSRTLSP